MAAMRVNSDPTGCRPSLGVDVLIAEGGIGPRPAGTHHQRLEVVLAGIADRDGAGVFPVVVDDESLGRQRTGIPVAIIARLSLLGSVDAEQSDALLAEPNGIAI
jgi:hypothetical protein